MENMIQNPIIPSNPINVKPYLIIRKDQAKEKFNSILPFENKNINTNLNNNNSSLENMGTRDYSVLKLIDNKENTIKNNIYIEKNKLDNELANELTLNNNDQITIYNKMNSIKANWEENQIYDQLENKLAENFKIPLEKTKSLVDVKTIDRIYERNDSCAVNANNKSRKNILNLFEKIKIIDKSHRNSLKMNKITFRKSDTIIPNSKLNKFKTSHEKSDLSINDKLSLKNNMDDKCYNLVCFICDLIFKKNPNQFQVCEHFICEKCGKAFFEEKIEQGEKRITCPSFKCFSEVNDEKIKLLVSEKHFNQYKKENMKSNLPLKSKNCNDLPSAKTINAKKEYIKIHNQKHVLEIATHECFLNLNKAREIFCIKCYEPALFGKIGKNFIKCLNCLNFTCKYCLKDLESDHFVISSNNYCKIFFRKKTITTKVSIGMICFKSILLSITIIVLSYFVFVFGVINFVNNFTKSLIQPLDKINHYCSLLAHFLIWIILGVVILVLFWMIIPFFPLIIAIYR